jgi:hypothetical protein
MLAAHLWEVGLSLTHPVQRRFAYVTHRCRRLRALCSDDF